MSPVSTGKLLADRYRVVGRLGAGGMALVVLAEDERLGRRVAVKRLHADSPDDAARRFQREARLGASLNHPNIVAVYDIACDEEGVLIVMEYVEGHTLRQELDRGALPPARTIELLSGVAAGLDHAHAAGVVHRDVKPANVLIPAAGGGAKITDLGIATAAERTNITRSGVVLGTAAYMAPERLDGNAGGPEVDVYALAAVAFEALAGRKAITGRTAMEVARRVVSEAPPDLGTLVPDAPRRAADVLHRGLSKDPAERPASAGELVRELAAAYAEAAEAKPTAPLAETEPKPTAPPKPVARRETPRPQAVAAARPEPRPADTQPRERRDAPARRRGWLVPGALAGAMALVAVLIVVLASGGGGGGGDDAGDRTAAGDTKAARESGSGSGATGGDAESGSEDGSAAPADPGSGSASETPGAARPGTDGSAADPDPSTPTGAVQALYTRAAADDFDGAWSLGTERLHAFFGGQGRFNGTFRTLESITFNDIRTASENGDQATVEFSTVAKHTDHTDRCTGTATLVRQGGGWLVDRLQVGC